MAKITLKDGRVVHATFIRQYPAFEGGMRYIFYVNGYGDVRCIKDENGNFKEYVA